MDRGASSSSMFLGLSRRHRAAGRRCRSMLTRRVEANDDVDNDDDDDPPPALERVSTTRRVEWRAVFIVGPRTMSQGWCTALMYNVHTINTMDLNRAGDIHTMSQNNIVSNIYIAFRRDGLKKRHLKSFTFSQIKTQFYLREYIISESK